MTVTNQLKDRVQLVTYLVRKFGSEGVPIIKVMKMIALADIYALRNYGTTLSKDEYFAMRNGPVATDIDTIVEQSNEYLGDVESLQYVEEFLRRDKGNTWSNVYARKEADLNYLSEWDREVIDMMYDKYKDATPQQLIDITHKYKAWSKHKEELANGKKQVPIDICDFFENDGEFAVAPEVIEMSKECYGTV